MDKNFKHSEITALIIKAFFNVYNVMRYGFLEKVYEKSLLIELKKSGLNCVAQCPVEVFYSNENVGYYLADIIVNNSVIIEIKSAECICEAHEAQLTNYLKASEIEVGIILNFGKKPEFKRKVFSSEFKDLNRS